MRRGEGQLCLDKPQPPLDTLQPVGDAIDAKRYARVIGFDGSERSPLGC
jgi:hypothetical protein